MTPTHDDHLERAKTAKRESKYLDFKESFDPKSDGEWCELLKDLVAMANSGGGVVVVGVKNNGTSSGIDPKPVLGMDLAVVTDKVFKYTNQHFSGIHIRDVKRPGNKTVAALIVDPVPVPLVFARPGTYSLPTKGKQKQKVAFSRGVVYVRHGAKSEPADTADLTEVVERRVDELREQWMGGIRKVVEAPADTNVAVYHPTERDESGRLTEVRLTTEPGAPVFGMVDTDKTHPHRQKELVKEVNKRLPKGRSVNTYDVLCVRRVHNIDASAPEFAHQPKFGSMQYSDAFTDWLVEQDKKNPDFFKDARRNYYDTHHG
jgi:hypothetical protein